MKRMLLVVALLLSSVVTVAQSLSFDEPTYSKDGVRLELLDVQNDGALVKYLKLGMDGKVQQEGYYLDGKPHGIWKMYMPNGSFTTMKFINGKRIVMNTIIDGRRTEVFYANNRPVRSISYFE